MRLPGLKVLTDKWVLIGLAAGAGVYFFTQHPSHMYKKKKHHGQGGGMGPGYGQYPTYDRPGLYEVPGQQGDFSHMRFSGQAELQRRLTVV